MFRTKETWSQELSNTKQHATFSLDTFVVYDDLQYVDNHSQIIVKIWSSLILWPKNLI